MHSPNKLFTRNQALPCGLNFRIGDMEDSFLDEYLDYRKVASTNASRFVTRLVYMHTQNDNFLIRSPS